MYETDAGAEPKVGDRGTCGTIVMRLMNAPTAEELIRETFDSMCGPRVTEKYTEVCGAEIVLVEWISPLAKGEGGSGGRSGGRLSKELRWKHAGQEGFMLDHNHTPTLGGPA
jgi:hypothetical protein